MCLTIVHVLHSADGDDHQMFASLLLLHMSVLSASEGVLLDVQLSVLMGP